jgi:hypothetical protein
LSFAWFDEVLPIEGIEPGLEKQVGLYLPEADIC